MKGIALSYVKLNLNLQIIEYNELWLALFNLKQHRNSELKFDEIVEVNLNNQGLSGMQVNEYKSFILF
jgi:hypothetical protein